MVGDVLYLYTYLGRYIYYIFCNTLEDYCKSFIKLYMHFCMIICPKKEEEKMLNVLLFIAVN